MSDPIGLALDELLASYRGDMQHLRKAFYSNLKQQKKETTMKLEIETGVEIPKTHTNNGLRGPYYDIVREMNYGQSAWFSDDEKKNAASFLNAMNNVPGAKAVQRKMEKDGVPGIRVWKEKSYETRNN